MLSRPTRVLVAALFAVSLLLTATAALGAPIVIKACNAPTKWGWDWCPDESHTGTPRTVKWKNPTSTTHTVKFYRGPWKGLRKVLDPGDVWDKRVTSAGKYKYRCDIQGHSKMVDGRCRGMCGKVIAH